MTNKSRLSHTAQINSFRARDTHNTTTISRPFGCIWIAWHRLDDWLHTEVVCLSENCHSSLILVLNGFDTEQLCWYAQHSYHYRQAAPGRCRLIKVYKAHGERNAMEEQHRMEEGTTLRLMEVDLIFGLKSLWIQNKKYNHLWPLYGSAYVSRQTYLRTGGFC